MKKYWKNEFWAIFKILKSGNSKKFRTVNSKFNKMITLSVLDKWRKFYVSAQKSPNIYFGATRWNFSKWLNNY
jgi:hypothetical protein